MKSFHFFFFFLLFPSCLYSQHRNAIWCFGDSSGIDFRNTFSPSVFVSGINSKGTCASVSDSLGNLLFYTGTPDIRYFNNGILKAIVYNKDHLQMVNGDSLDCEVWYHEIVIIPDPGNQNLYYIFHVGVTGQYGLYYSVIDMTQDSGRGAVISKNNQLRTEPAVDCIQAVKNGNGRDWWLLFEHWQNPNNLFYI